MLIGMILRGVSFDFRVKARAARKAMWNRLFALGSLMAARRRAGCWAATSRVRPRPWSLLFALGIALTLPTAYAMLGAGWLIMKTGERCSKRRALGRAGAVADGRGAGRHFAGDAAGEPHGVREVVRDAAVHRAAADPGGLRRAFYARLHVDAQAAVVAAGYGWVVFASTVLIFVLAFLGLAYSLYPYIVIDRSPSWQAASATKSLRSSSSAWRSRCPRSSIYTIFMYRVFWGTGATLLRPATTTRTVRRLRRFGRAAGAAAPCGTRA
jgi:cytochrome d ubiquinol oxidase subunit II